MTDAIGFHFAVRAYDPSSGALLWSDLVNKGGGLDSASSVSVRGGRVVVAGQGGAGCSFGATSDCDWLVRSYRTDSGVLAWEKQVDGQHLDDQANVVLACQDQVIVAGASGSDPNASFADWRVQVLTASDGSLVSDEVLSTPGTFAFPTGIAVAKGHILVTGSTLDFTAPVQTGDFVVRASLFRDNGSCHLANNAATR